LIFLGKLYGVFFIYIWSRGTLPRLRIDQLMAFAWKFLLPLSLVNVMIVGGEKLLWQEAELSSGEALPVFGVINWVMAVALIAGWAWFLGHQHQERVAHRALLTKEVGTIHFGEPAPTV